MRKAGMIALLMALLDLIAIGVIGYVAMQTMSLIIWTFLLILGLIFAYDAAKAMLFVTEMFKR